MNKISALLIALLLVADIFAILYGAMVTIDIFVDWLSH